MARDKFHGAVRAALEKEGWTITADPYEVSVGDVDFEIDLAAEMIAAQRAGEKIALLLLKVFLVVQKYQSSTLRLGNL